MNDNAAIEEFAPYVAAILWRLVSTGDTKLRIPAPSRLPPITPERVIGGLRRRDVTYKQWVTRACQRFADKHPDMISCCPFTATPEQLARLEAFVDRHRSYVDERLFTAPAPRLMSPYQRTAERCAPPPPIDKALVLSLLDQKMMRRRLETSDSKAALNAAILFLVNPKSSKRAIPASELLPLINIYPDCPEETCYTLIRLSSVHDIVPVGHILNAAELGWWQRVDVLLGRIERNHKPKVAPLIFPEPTQAMMQAAGQGIRDYISIRLPLPRGYVLQRRTFTPSKAATKIRGMHRSVYENMSSDIRVTAAKFKAHTVARFAKEFGFPSSDGRTFHVTDELFTRLLIQLMLTDKPR